MADSRRTLIIGDVHGCVDELQALLKAARHRPGDRVIFVGDLVNRGPDSHGVLALARSIRAESVLGNHERRLLRFRASGDESLLKSYDPETLEQLTPEDWAYMEAMPLTIELIDAVSVVVHGGFLPALPWQDQPAEIVTRIQVIDAEGQAAKRSDVENGTPWADLWQGPPFVYYGHTPRPELFERPFSLGLDTGCVLGGQLSACILPGKHIVQVPARQAYLEKTLTY